MAVKSKSGKGEDKGITKSGFIRSLPDRTPAKEVIAKAKEVGLDLNEKFVWTVQSEMRSKAKGGSKKPAKKAGAKAPAAAAAKSKGGKASAAAPKSVNGASSQAKQLKALIVELGTARADELYRSVRKELDAMLSK